MALLASELAHLSGADAALARGVAAGSVSADYLASWRARRDALLELSDDDHDAVLQLVSEAEAVTWQGSDLISNFRLLLADPVGYVKRWLTPGQTAGVAGSFTPFATVPVPAGAVTTDSAASSLKTWLFAALVLVVLALLAYLVSELAGVARVFAPRRAA